MWVFGPQLWSCNSAPTHTSHCVFNCAFVWLQEWEFSKIEKILAGGAMAVD